MQTLEGTFFGELCSIVCSGRREGNQEPVN